MATTDHEMYHAHNVKMPTIVAIITFISMTDTTYWNSETRNVSLQNFSFFELLYFMLI